MRLAKLLKSSLISIWCVTTSAQLFATEQNRTPAAYFMEQPPADIEPNNIPKGAQDVIVAKVRLDQPVLCRRTALRRLYQRYLGCSAQNR
jgi:hypothetical protein